MAEEKDTRLDHIEGILEVDLVSQIFVKLHQHPVFILNFQLLTIPQVAYDELFGLIFQFIFQIVVFSYFPYRLDISLHYFIFLSDFRKSVAHFIEKVAKGNDSHDLNNDCYQLFLHIFGADVSVANGEHSSACKVDRINIFGEERFTLNANTLDPVVIRIDLGSTEENYSLNR